MTLQILNYINAPHRYRPSMGIFYGVNVDGALNMTMLDLGGKSFEQTVGTEVTYKKTKGMKVTSLGGLDLGNWGRTLKGKALSNAQDPFDCSGGEVAVHFELTSELTEGSVTVDQVSKAGQINEFVQRAGWYLKYE